MRSVGTKRLEVATALGLALVLAVAGAQAGDKEPQIVDSPLVAGGLTHNGLAQELVFGDQVYRDIKRRADVLMTGFPAAPGEYFDLELEQFTVFNGQTRFVRDGETPAAAPDVVLLRGQIAGEVGSRVFLGLSPNGCNGYIDRGDEMYVVATYAPNALTPAERVTVSYLREAQPGPTEPTQWECTALPTPPRPGVQVGGFELDAFDLINTDSGGQGGIASSNCVEAIVAIETDHEFYLIFGDETAANTYIAQIVAAVSDMYERDLGVQLELGFSRLWTTPADPYEYSWTDELYEFQAYWNTYMTHIERASAHLLSGKGGGGVAWVAAICYPEYDYALSNVNGYFPQPTQSHQPDGWDLFVVAHEWGHNFGAYHTHDYGIDTCDHDCGGGPYPGTIMSYCHLCDGGMTNIALEFNALVQLEMEAFIPTAGCVTESVSCDFFLRGDLNCDGVINGFDIDPFVLAVGDLNAYYAAYPHCDGGVLADMNADARVDGFDIDPFIDVVGG